MTLTDLVEKFECILRTPGGHTITAKSNGAWSVYKSGKNGYQIDCDTEAEAVDIVIKREGLEDK